jgi:hypothetical protein
MREFKVGYKKPPKEHQFTPKNQTAARRNGGERNEDIPDIAALLEKPVPVSRRGKSVRMHPHEAMMNSLGKRALKGERRAAKEFLRQCDFAELLAPQHVQQNGGVFRVPPGVESSVVRVMLKSYGLPPWDPDEYAAIAAEHERDVAHVEEVYQQFLKDLDHE